MSQHCFPMMQAIPVAARYALAHHTPMYRPSYFPGKGPQEGILAGPSPVGTMTGCVPCRVVM